MASKNVVLVHGGFVDGSGWQGVYDILSEGGYTVSIVQNPTLSLGGDVEVTRRVIEAQDEPVILVGHSYGGAVITEAGNHPNVEKLVYIAAFAPDQGESVNTLIEGFPKDGPAPPILPPQDGFLFLDREKFHDSFAADVSDEDAAFMSRLAGSVGRRRAGRNDQRRSVAEQARAAYLIATEDRMIPPAGSTTRCRGGRVSTVDEAAGSHAHLRVEARGRDSS